MFIPHSEKNIFNFQISLSMLIFLLFLIVILVFGFLYSSINFSIKRQELDDIIIAQKRLELIERKFDQERRKLDSLLHQKKQLELILKSDQEQVESILKYKSQYFKTLLNRNDLISLIYAIQAGLFVAILQLWHSKRRSEKRTARIGIEDS